MEQKSRRRTPSRLPQFDRRNDAAVVPFFLCLLLLMLMHNLSAHTLSGSLV